MLLSVVEVLERSSGLIGGMSDMDEDGFMYDQDDDYGLVSFA